jgi:peptidylprolyl isomerase
MSNVFVRAFIPRAAIAARAPRSA